MQSLVSEVKQILNECAQNGGEELRQLGCVSPNSPQGLRCCEQGSCLMHPLVSFGGGRTPVGCCTGCAVKLLSRIRHELTLSSLEERAGVKPGVCI